MTDRPESERGRAAAGSLPLDAPVPVARAGLFSIVSVAFALVAHSTTSHTLPSVWLVCLSVLVVAATAHPLTALEHRLPSLVTGLVATQLVLHTVFQLQATGRSNASAAGWLCCGSDATPLRTGTAAHSGGALDRSALVQLATHVLAALVIAAALRLREQNVWNVARRAAARAGVSLGALITSLVSLVAAVLPVETGPLARRAQPDRSVPAPVRSVLIDARAPRRGPPVPSALRRLRTVG